MAKPTVLIVGFEFPPSNGASVQRILSVYNAFVDSGWQVDVLSVDPKAYADGNTVGGVPESSVRRSGHILRPKAWDVQRDFAYKGKYPGWLMSPDRWGLTWVPNAMCMLKQHIKQHGVPDLIWSSAPIASVHFVGYQAQQLTKAIWFADYRDPMPYLHRDDLPWYQRIPQRWIDKKVAKKASCLSFATAGMQQLYQDALAVPEHRCMVVKNGFVQANFDQAQMLDVPEQLFRPERFSLYYAGVLYPQGRCPRAVFEAVKRWNSEHPERLVEVVFQGVPDADAYVQMTQELAMYSDVRFLPKTTYLQSLKNMQAADGLLLIQDARFRDQIPGKLYEYLNTDLPVLLKAPEKSATAQEAMSFDGVRRGESSDDLFEALREIVSMQKVPQRVPVARAELSRERQAQTIVSRANQMIGMTDRSVDESSLQRRA